MSTLRISNIEAKSVPASATIDEKVKITNSSGDTLVFLDGKTSGITTVGINTTDGNITFDANSNVVVTGIITATRFSGEITPTSLEIGSNIKLGNAGVITATSFVGSGANLTSLPAQVTLSNNADNRVITGGSGTNLNGEANLTFDGSILSATGSATPLSGTGHNYSVNIYRDAGSGYGYFDTVTGSSNHTGVRIRAYHNGTYNNVFEHTTGDYTRFYTGGTERLRIDQNGRIRLGGDPSGTTVSALDVTGGTSTITDVMLVKGNTGNGFIRFQDNDNSCNFTLGADDGSGLGSGAFILYDRSASAYRWSVDSSGNIKVHSGNIVIGTAGKGIDFSAASGSASGSSSALLDDYEEGTWTPAVQFDVGGSGITYGTRGGTYVKVGRMVHLQYYMNVTGGVSSSDYFARLSLPFTGIGVAHQDARIRQYNNTISDWFVSLGGSAPVFFESNGLGNGATWARGDNVNGVVLSGQYTLYVS